MGRIVLHVDFDYFYAQCEESRRPDLRTRPVVVCVFSDRGNDSGAVATANYVARRSGVKSGMPIRSARARLSREPGAAFLPTDFDYYSDVSQRAMDTMRQHADTFEYVGRDEAYLDVSDRIGGDYDKAAHLAQRIKNAVRESVRLTCSVGITPNKLLSKIASDYRKPDGLTVVLPDKVGEFLEPLRIRDIPGIGGKTERVFSRMGLKTVGDLRSLDVFELHRRFGRKTGAYIYNAARGMDDEPVAEREPRVQYGRIVTLKRDSGEFDYMSGSLADLCEELHRVVTRDRRLFKSVGVQLVLSDLSQRSKSRMLRNPTSGLAELQRTAGQLLREALAAQEKPVRRLGVKVSELSELAGQSRMDSYF